jgi:Flp pilus assembly protein TadG
MPTLLDRNWTAFRRGVVVRLGAFRRADTGVAAVEFAIILPLMVFMYLGMTELTTGINVNRKLTLVSRTLADLTTRMTDVTGDGIDIVFSAAKAVMQPYDASRVAMAVTSVTVVQGPTAGTYTGKVAWSCTQGTGLTARPVDSAFAVPSGFEASPSFVFVETKLDYVPMFGARLINGMFVAAGGTLALRQETPWPVRSGTPLQFQSTGMTVTQGSSTKSTPKGNPCT